MTDIGHRRRLDGTHHEFEAAGFSVESVTIIEERRAPEAERMRGARCQRRPARRFSSRSSSCPMLLDERGDDAA